MSTPTRKNVFALARVLFIAALTSFMLFGIFYFGFEGTRENEARINRDLLAASIASVEATEALICTLSAPLSPGPSGNTIRDEGFVNSICIIPHGLEPFDVNGDGVIDATRPNVEEE